MSTSVVSPLAGQAPDEVHPVNVKAIFYEALYFTEHTFLQVIWEYDIAKNRMFMTEYISWVGKYHKLVLLFSRGSSLVRTGNSTSDTVLVPHVV